jgi:hypothetical protein
VASRRPRRLGFRALKTVFPRGAGASLAKWRHRVAGASIGLKQPSVPFVAHLCEPFFFSWPPKRYLGRYRAAGGDALKCSGTALFCRYVVGLLCIFSFFMTGIFLLWSSAIISLRKVVWCCCFIYKVRRNPSSRARRKFNFQ